MRRRLISSTLAVVLVVISVFGLSLALVEARTITEGARESVGAEAVRLTGVVENRLAAGEAVDSGTLAEQLPPGRRARIDIPGRPPVLIGPQPSGDVIEARVEGARGETVTVQQPRAAVTDEIVRTLLVILMVSLLAVAAAVFLALGQARRLVSPLTDLAETAERLGSGDPRPRHRRYGV
ncbi:two-component sensor histidine kinase, partial [Streptomyces sp. DJ]